MIYEFECKMGHVTESMVKMGTETIICPDCISEQIAISKDGGIGAWNATARRIMSATRTTFVFADTNRRIKQIKEISRKE